MAELNYITDFETFIFENYDESINLEISAIIDEEDDEIEYMNNNQITEEEIENPNELEEDVAKTAIEIKRKRREREKRKKALIRQIGQGEYNKRQRIAKKERKKKYRLHKHEIKRSREKYFRSTKGKKALRYAKKREAELKK